jgi:hypothetical protein
MSTYPVRLLLSGTPEVNIQTPEFYPQNAGKTIFRKTLCKIKKEIQFGASEFQNVKSGKSQLAKLFEKPRFFSIHTGFIMIKIFDVDFRLHGFVESRVLKFLKTLNQIEDIATLEPLSRTISFEEATILIIGFSSSDIYPISEILKEFVKRTMIDAVCYLLLNGDVQFTFSILKFR